MARQRRRLPARLGRRPGWLIYLSVLGPGLIAANAGNDAGGIATYSSVGAAYGYSLLWMMVISTVALIIVQEQCARLGAATGQGLADLIRENFGARWTTFAMLSLLLANAGITISEFAGIGAALELFGISKYLSVPVAAGLVWWLVVKGSYARIERLFVVMTLVFFAYPISALLIQPDWGEVGRNLILPSFRLEQGYIFLFVATVGTTITPYMQLFVQSGVVEKGVTIDEYPYTRADVILGSIFANVIAIFIIIATAATLFRAGVTPIETADQAAQALAPLAGPYAFVLFGIGLLGASFLAAGVLPLTTAFSLTEAIGTEKGLDKDFTEAKLFYGIFTGLIVLGAVVTLLPGLNVWDFLVAVQAINGVFLPILLVFITSLAGRRDLLGAQANGPILRLAAWATTVVIGGLAILLLIATIILPILGINLGVD